MSPLIRKLLFYAFVMLFILSGTIIISYSLGWKIDFNPPAGGFILERTGAISIKTDPKNVIIKINGKNYPDQSGILQSATLISGLLPKTYDVEINKDGYLPYHKNISVKPALVSKLSSIRLIPDKISSDTISQVKGNVFIDSADNSSKFIIQNQKTGIYYFYDLNNLSSFLNLTNAFENSNPTSTIKKAKFVPFKTTQFAIEDSSGLKILDTETGNTSLIVKNPAVWTIENSSVYYIKTPAGKNKNPVLYCYNAAIQAQCLSVEIPKIFSLSRFIQIKSFNNKVAFLNSTGGLYLFDPNSDDIKEIAHNAKFFIFSPDNKKIAFLDKDGKLGIQFLDNYSNDFIKKSGDVIRFDLENKSEITSIAWYNDSNHLFLDYGAAVKFMEIDERLPLNIYMIAANVQNYYYDFKTDIFYFISGGKIQKIDFNNQ